MAKNNQIQPTKVSKGGSAVAPCSCKSQYQDDHYGHQNRVHNYCTIGSRCTVCGSIKK